MDSTLVNEVFGTLFWIALITGAGLMCWRLVEHWARMEKHWDHIEKSPVADDTER